MSAFTLLMEKMKMKGVQKSSVQVWKDLNAETRLNAYTTSMFVMAFKTVLMEKMKIKSAQKSSVRVWKSLNAQTRLNAYTTRMYVMAT